MGIDGKKLSLRVYRLPLCGTVEKIRFKQKSVQRHQTAKCVPDYYGPNTNEATSEFTPLRITSLSYWLLVIGRMCSNTQPATCCCWAVFILEKGHGQQLTFLIKRFTITILLKKQKSLHLCPRDDVGHWSPDTTKKEHRQVRVSSSLTCKSKDVHVRQTNIEDELSRLLARVFSCSPPEMLKKFEFQLRHLSFVKFSLAWT